MRLESIQEGTTLALDQLRANKSRSALTILAVVVGMAVVMAMAAIVSGLRTSIIGMMLQGGPQNFVVMRYDPNAPLDPNHQGPAWGRNPPVSPEEIARVAQLPGIEAAVGEVSARVVMTYAGHRITDVDIRGEGDAFLQARGGTVPQGHTFRASDVEAARPVGLITPQLATDLFGTLDPIGRRVRMKGQSFEIIGIYKPAEGMFGGAWLPAGRASKHLAVVPYTAAIKYLDAWADFTDILVRPADGVSQADVMDRVTVLLRTMRSLRPGEPNTFVLVKLEEFVGFFNRMTGIFFVVMIALSSVALIVGGVGVIAIMMIAVAERTREIGIRKALGATQHEILFQFLIEAVTVTVIGVAIGMLVGVLLSFLVAALSPIPARVPAWAVVAALAMAVMAGVLFGLWPARRAARMDPGDARRYE